MIKKVAQNIEIPLLVGGGIVDLQGIQDAYHAGADLVVIGTAFENNTNFFNDISFIWHLERNVIKWCLFVMANLCLLHVCCDSSFVGMAQS
jgi:imidazole glycerol phosphate synthase subunit HisF